MGTNKFGKHRSSLFWKGSTLQLLGVIIFPLALLVLIFALGGAFAHQQAMRRMIGERDALAVSAAASTLSAEMNHRVAAMRGLAQRINGVSETPEEVLIARGLQRGTAEKMKNILKGLEDAVYTGKREAHGRFAEGLPEIIQQIEKELR